ncbi:MAG: DNA polymerase III subunit beta [Patescibacteria group bacterium]|nr:DNA polymerase III subunit beta [Patescibacteria group bacterium]MDD4610689.1 DNA polymerase III subunit beta [Patescibacteria group bacterium]
MKISSLQENLKQGLLSVGHIAGRNVNLPILNNVLIEARDGNIKIVTTNLEIGIVNYVRGKIESEGSFTVDSKIINDYINLLPNKKVEIELKDNSLKIECENFKTKIMGQSAEEYPLIPVIDKNSYYSVDIDEFKKALSQVVSAVSNNEARLELSGVLFSFDEKKLTLAATDSYRLAEKELGVKLVGNDGVSEAKKTIVPARTVQEVIRVLSSARDMGEDEEKAGGVKIYVSDSQILFVVGLVELTSRVIEGQYPDYKQIIPTNIKTTATVNRQELIRAVKASSLFSKTGINDINLDFPKEKNQTVVSSASGQTGESVINMESMVKGDDNGVIVNYRYLLDGLNNIQDENIKIEIIDNNTPCILKPEKESGYLYIIMPIKQ